MAANSNTPPYTKLTPPDSQGALRKTSSSLSKVLASRRQAIKELTQIHQLRATLKHSVTDQIENNLRNTLAGSQLRDLINHRGTQAELNRIINRLTLSPQQDIIHLTDAVAKEVIAASDHRLQLLARLATKNAKDGRGDIQKNLTEAIRRDPKAELALKLIESKQIDGTESNQIRESLKQASLNESSGRPRISGVSQQIEDELSSAILTSSSITEDDARQLVDKVDIDHQLTAEEKTQLSESVVVTSAIMDQNTNIVELRAQLATDQTDAGTLSNKLHAAGITSSDLINDFYESDDSPKTPINLDVNNVRLVSKIVENPELLNNPTVYQELLNAPRFSPSELVRKWQTFTRPEFSPTISTSTPLAPSFAPQGLGKEVGSWIKTAGSQTQVGAKSFLDSIRSFLGGGGSGGIGSFLKSGSSTMGNGLKSMGGALGQGIKALGKSVFAGAKALGGKFAAAIAAAGPEILAAIGITAAVALAIIGIIVLLQWLTNGSYKKSASNITPIGGEETATMYGCDPAESDCPTVQCSGSDCKWPVQCGCITQGPFAGTHSKNHLNAIDIMTNNCQGIVKVQSVTKGTVSFVHTGMRWGQSGGPGNYGNHVIINATTPDGKSFQLLYAHMIDIQVKVGDAVDVGTVIGTADQTGMGDAHLHFEIRGSGGSVRDILPPEAQKIKDNCGNLQSCGGICLK